MSGQLVVQNVQLYNRNPSDAEGGRDVSIVLRGRTGTTQQLTDLSTITASHHTAEPDERAQLVIRVHGGGEGAGMVDVATLQTDRVVFHHTTNVPSLSVQGLQVGRDAHDGSLVLAAPNTQEAAALASQPLGSHVGDKLPLLPYTQLQWGATPYRVTTWGTPAVVPVTWPQAFPTVDAAGGELAAPTIWVTPQPDHTGPLAPWPYTWSGPSTATQGTVYVGLQPPTGYPTTPAAADAVPDLFQTGTLHWLAMV